VPKPKKQPRVERDTYAMMLAFVASLRSEDPTRKVGAVALDANGYVIGVAYNGVKSKTIMPDDFWSDRDGRRKYMIHAEQNLCALFKRGDAETVAVTTKPCPSCANLLVAHGVRRVIYGEDYTDDSSDILSTYGIESRFIPIADVLAEINAVSTARACPACNSGATTRRPTDDFRRTVIARPGVRPARSRVPRAG